VELIRSKKLLFGIVVVLLLMISVLPGCNKEPPVEADELVIPSSMSPYEVLKEITNAGPRIDTFPFMEGALAPDDIELYGPQGASTEQYIKGFGSVFPEISYTKRDGKQVGYGLYKLVLDISVFKYEDTESAERSFINISKTEELQDSTYGGIDLKSGTYTLPWWWEELEELGSEWDESTMPFYLIHSGCFVIYFYGREDVSKDMLDRIIVAFGNDSANATITTL
jgi:hypothetical protein